MTVAEIEKLILTKGEAAALEAAALSTLMSLAVHEDENAEQAIKSLEIGLNLSSALEKVIKLNDELKKGVREEKENA